MSVGSGRLFAVWFKGPNFWHGQHINPDSTFDAGKCLWDAQNARKWVEDGVWIKLKAGVKI